MNIFANDITSKRQLRPIKIFGGNRYHSKTKKYVQRYEKVVE